MKNLLIIAVILFLFDCESKEQKNMDLTMESDSIKLPDEYTIIVPDSTQLQYQFVDFYKSVELTSSELKKIELLIIKALLEESKNSEYISIRPSKLHLVKRQYVSYLNKQGERIVWVNAFCEVPGRMIEISPEEFKLQEMDWKNEIVQVNDGGSCFWNITINMDTKKSEVYINGVG